MSKRIKMKCSCGAEIDVSDSRGSYAGNMGVSHMEDEHGRRYLVQVIADQWLERHQNCIDKRNADTAKASLNEQQRNGVACVASNAKHEGQA